MIRFIHGELAGVEDGVIYIEAAGVGYGIHVPQTVLSMLPAIGSELRVYTYFKLSQDGSCDLYGFLSPEDRSMFTMLLTVSGVGPKGALGLLSVMTPDALRLAIVSGDTKAISRAPGVGSKTAQRMVLELKDKIDAAGVFGELLENGSSGSVPAGSLNSQKQEAVEALIALGYSNQEAVRAVKKVENADTMNADEILKKSLKNLAFL